MPRQSRVLFAISSLLTASILLYFFASAAQQSRRSFSLTSKPPYRACIITLMRSDTLVSLNKLLNMLHSLRLYFHNLHRYTIYLFHESTLTKETKDHIRLCASNVTIQFHGISFDIPSWSNRSSYASMCQFWSYDLWFKDDFVRTHCDYVMRFDDDSYLTNSTEVDLFEQFHQRRSDFAYRIIYHDTNGLEFLRDHLRKFLPRNQMRRGCIEGLCTSLNGRHGYDGLAVYNNFFLLRVNLFYEHAVVEQYLNQLVSINAFHRYRIGDANIQTLCLLLIEKPLRISHLTFAYNHNVHGATALAPSFVFFENMAQMWNAYMRVPNVTCRKLFIATKHKLIEKQMDSDKNTSK